MARKEKRPMWGLYGGFMVSSDCYTDDQNHRHYFGIMQGLVVTEPKRLLTDPNKRKQREQRKYISFTVATDPQERWRVRVYETEKFFNIAQALQRFDTVLLCGEYVEYEYTLRTGRLAGEIRTGRDYRVTFILPAFAILDPEATANLSYAPPTNIPGTWRKEPRTLTSQTGRKSRRIRFWATRGG